MKAGIATLVIVLLTLSTTALCAQESSEFIGTWSGLDRGVFGSIALESNGSATFIIGKDTMGGPGFNLKGEPAEMRYRIDTSITPHTIDFAVVRMNDFAEVGMLSGIFIIEKKNKMILCLNYNGEERPASLDDETCMSLERKGKP